MDSKFGELGTPSSVTLTTQTQTAHWRVEMDVPELRIGKDIIVPALRTKRHTVQRGETIAMPYSISTLLIRNLRDVFGENDPARRRAAIDEIFTEDCVPLPENGSRMIEESFETPARSCATAPSGFSDWDERGCLMSATQVRRLERYRVSADGFTV
jgi:hypothetical protein